MSLTTLEVLIAARELIADEKRWTRGHWAESPDSQACSANSPKACKWCARGALLRVTKDEAARVWSDAEGALIEAADAAPNGYHPVVYVNDFRGHAATLAMFDRAITLSRAKAKEAGT